MLEETSCPYPYSHFKNRWREIFLYLLDSVLKPVRLPLLRQKILTPLAFLTSKNFTTPAPRQKSGLAIRLYPSRSPWPWLLVTPLSPLFQLGRNKRSVPNNVTIRLSKSLRGRGLEKCLNSGKRFNCFCLTVSCTICLPIRRDQTNADFCYRNVEDRKWECLPLVPWSFNVIAINWNVNRKPLSTGTSSNKNSDLV